MSRELQGREARRTAAAGLPNRVPARRHGARDVMRSYPARHRAVAEEIAAAGFAREGRSEIVRVAGFQVAMLSAARADAVQLEGFGFVGLEIADFTARLAGHNSGVDVARPTRVIERYRIALGTVAIIVERARRGKGNFGLWPDAMPVWADFPRKNRARMGSDAPLARG